MKMPTAGNITTIAEAKEASTLSFNKKQYGDLIHARRSFLGLTQAQLAQNLGVQKAYIAHWEAGRARPDLNLIPSLCRELGISIAAFFNAPSSLDSLSDAEQRHMEEYRSISPRDRVILDATLSKMAEIATAELWDRCRTQFHPIYHNYQQAAAGSGLALEADESGDQVFIRNNWMSDRADEIVTVNGSSMEPKFHDGQDVYVEHTPELAIGEIGLFVINGDGFIKQYQGSYLHSLNPEYGDIQLGEYDESRTVGRVLGVVEDGDYPTREEQRVLEEILQEKK